MKHFFPILALFALLLSSCGGRPESISDISNPTAEDSLMYYYGQMNANNYWYDALSDTILKTEDARREFMEGFIAGLRDGKDNDAYNKGLQLGARLASRVNDFETAYNLVLPKDVLIGSMQAGLANDTNIDIADAQKQFYLIKDRFEGDKGAREAGLSRKSLAKAAGKTDMTMVNDSLYCKKISSGGGQKFKKGDKVEIMLTASTIDGNAIGRQFPPKITIGEGRLPEIVNVALLTMSDGETCMFMTTPRALLGRKFEKYFISAQDPVYFSVKASLLPNSDNLDNTPPPMPLTKSPRK